MAKYLKESTSKAIFLKQGKNLAKINEFEAINDAGGVYLVRADIMPETQYTISFTESRIPGVTISNNQLFNFTSLTYYNAKNEIISLINGDAYSLPSGSSVNIVKTITTPSECTHIVIDFRTRNADGNKNVKVTNIQIEEGSQATAFEPYIDMTLNLKKGDKLQELLNIDEVKEPLNIITGVPVKTGRKRNGKDEYVVNFESEVEITIKPRHISRHYKQYRFFHFKSWRYKRNRFALSKRNQLDTRKCLLFE